MPFVRGNILLRKQVGFNSKKLFQKWGALGSVYFIPGRRTIFVKTLKTSFYRQIEIIALQTTSWNFMLVEDESSCSMIYIVMRNVDFFLQRLIVNKYEFM